MENNDQMILSGLEAETFWLIGTYDNDYTQIARDVVATVALWLFLGRNLMTTKSHV